MNTMDRSRASQSQDSQTSRTYGEATQAAIAELDGISPSEMVGATYTNAAAGRNATSNNDTDGNNDTSRESRKEETPTSAAPDKGEFSDADVGVLRKQSSCELELDVHVKHILNSRLQEPSFGWELWEAEARR